MYFPHIVGGELRQKGTKHHRLSDAQPSSPRINTAVHEPERGAVRASRRVGLAAAAPATGMFEEGCSVRGGETWRRRWLPRQGKGDAETDGCVHREHRLCGEQHVGGCTTQSCSPSNCPGWITPVGTLTMIIIFPV